MRIKDFLMEELKWKLRTKLEYRKHKFLDWKKMQLSISKDYINKNIRY